MSNPASDERHRRAAPTPVLWLVLGLNVAVFLELAAIEGQLNFTARIIAGWGDSCRPL